MSSRGFGGVFQLATLPETSISFSRASLRRHQGAKALLTPYCPDPLSTAVAESAREKKAVRLRIAFERLIERDSEKSRGD
jgi:hypothetical protein